MVLYLLQEFFQLIKTDSVGEGLLTIGNSVHQGIWLFALEKL
jgi:hypothetical protein